MHVCQSPLEAIVIIRQTHVIDAHQVPNRGVEIVHVHRIFDGPKAELIGRTVRKGCLHTRASEDAGETLWIVITSRGPALKHRQSTELRAQNHQSFFENPTLLEIPDQDREVLVENGSMNFTGSVVLPCQTGSVSGTETGR